MPLTMDDLKAKLAAMDLEYRQLRWECRDQIALEEGEDSEDQLGFKEGQQIVWRTQGRWKFGTFTKYVAVDKGSIKIVRHSCKNITDPSIAEKINGGTYLVQPNFSALCHETDKEVDCAELAPYDPKHKYTYTIK